jgi:hypothetical protein
MYSESFATQKQPSQLLYYLKAVGFAILYVVVLRILFWMIPLDNLFYSLNISVAPAFSPLHLVGIFASGITSALIIVSAFLIVLAGYVWFVVARFFPTAKVAAAVNIFTTIMILNSIIPSSLNGGWEETQSTADSVITIIDQQYYPKGSTIANPTAASSMDESTVGMIMVQVQFTNISDRPLELSTMTAQDDPYSHLVNCTSESTGQGVLVGVTQESTHWCTLTDPEWFDNVSGEANTGDLPWWQKLLLTVIMQQASSSVPKNVIVNGKPLTLLLNFQTNTTQEEAKSGELPTKSYPFQTAASQWL